MDDGGHRGRAALGASVASRRGGCGGLAEGPVDGNSTAETVQPLLLVEDVVDLQRVRLCLARVLGTHTENVLGCGRKKKKLRMSELIYLTEDVFMFFYMNCLKLLTSTKASPLSALLKAPLKEPPILTSPSCRSSSTRSCTGIGCR